MAEEEEDQLGEETREELDEPEPVEDPQEKPPGVEDEKTPREQKSREIPPEKEQKWKNWKKAWET